MVFLLTKLIDIFFKNYLLEQIIELPIVITLSKEGIKSSRKVLGLKMETINY